MEVEVISQEPRERRLSKTNDGKLTFGQDGLAGTEFTLLTETTKTMDKIYETTVLKILDIR